MSNDNPVFAQEPTEINVSHDQDHDSQELHLHNNTLTNKLNKNNTLNIISNFSQLNDVFDCYKNHHKRCRNKKHIYGYAATFYNRAELCLFLIPLLLLAAINTVLPSVLENEERDTVKTATTIIAACTTLLVGLQGKLQWGKKSEKYMCIANCFQMLAGDSYFKMSQVKFDDSEEGAKKEELLRFLKESEKTEKNVLSGSEVLPKFLKVRGEKAATNDAITGAGCGCWR